MIDTLRLCPICNEGFMSPISEITTENDKSQEKIKFYECDNEYCRYRSAETGISRDVRIGDELDEPLMCSKCNIMFNTELEYKQHYDENHKPVENKI
jgi:hypothetical protein